MEIDIYDVGFGDCCIISNEMDSKLIVDCGGCANKKKIVAKDIVLNIIKYGKQKEVNALITHFHEDHVNGFMEMYKKLDCKKIFDKIYVPYIVGYNKEEIIFWKSVIIFYLILPKKTKAFKTSKAILGIVEMIVRLVKDVKNILPIKAFDKIESGKYRVIWPEVGVNIEEFENEKFDDAIESLYIEISKVIEVEELLQNINNNMEEFYELLVESKDIDLKERMENILKKQRDLVEKLKNKKDQLDEGFIKNIKKKNHFSWISKSFSKTMNASSIVFHNNSSKEREVLMMGDVTKKIIEKYLVKKFHKGCYRYIKVQHHGTETHYSDKLPNGNLVISNVKKRNYGIVAEKYKKKICQHSIRICTNKHQHCKSVKCINRVCGINLKLRLRI